METDYITRVLALEDPRHPGEQLLVVSAFHRPLPLAHTQHSFGFSYFFVATFVSSSQRHWDRRR